jgi:hypothetical protein
VGAMADASRRAARSANHVRLGSTASN